MKRNTISLALSAAALVLLVVAYLVDERDEAPAGSAEVAAESAESDAANIDTVEVQWSQPATPDPIVESLVDATGNCTVELIYIPDEAGTLVEAYQCVSEDLPKHPYANYSNETLAELAYSDATAAEILGLRHHETDFELALSWTTRAAALAGGDAEPILYLSDAYPHSSYTDGVANLETIRMKYVMSAVSDFIGSEHSNIEYWENKVREEFASPAEAIQAFNEEALKIVAEMRDIQNEVNGEVTIESP